MSALQVMRAGPAMSLQDFGRPGWMAQGLSRGGAADDLALDEGAALLGQASGLAALEMAGMGGTFKALGPLRIALTGAPMAVALDGQALAWNASYAVPKGGILDIGGVRSGVYGYLHVGGGFAGTEILGARSAHLAAGLGSLVKTGDILATGPDAGGDTGLGLTVADRCSGGTIHMMAGIQTERFGDAVLARFQATEFRRSPRANRQGVAMEVEGPGFAAEGQLDVVSEVIVPGDIQMTGDGLPFVLMSECQTTGGYPRIGTVLPCDLPRVAQAGPGAVLRFALLGREDAQGIMYQFAAHRAGLRRAVSPRVRDPKDIVDLLGYQLISGAVSAFQQPGDTEEVDL